jgi:hypothetical protein
VPPGQSWNVDGVDVDGLYLNGPGPASSVNVRFYANGAGNLPGKLEAERLALPFTGTGGDFVITVRPPVDLTEGVHWVSVQAQQNFTSAGQWRWVDRTVMSNSGVAWRNPGNGHGRVHGLRAPDGLLPTAPPHPEQVYRLRGTTGPPPPPPHVQRCVVPRVIGRDARAGAKEDPREELLGRPHPTPALTELDPRPRHRREPAAGGSAPAWLPDQPHDRPRSSVGTHQGTAISAPAGWLSTPI